MEQGAMAVQAELTRFMADSAAHLETIKISFPRSRDAVHKGTRRLRSRIVRFEVRVLQRVAVCCSVLQRVAVCCSVLQCAAVCFSVLPCVAVCCRVLPCVAVCYRVLPCVAVCCSPARLANRHANTITTVFLVFLRQQCTHQV